MKITKLEPNKLVEWECVDSRHPQDSGWSDLRDWVGTKIRFEIDEAGPYSSRLNFVHLGLIPQIKQRRLHLPGLTLPMLAAVTPAQDEGFLEEIIDGFRKVRHKVR